MKNRTSKDNTIVRKKVQTRRFNAVSEGCKGML